MTISCLAICLVCVRRLRGTGTTGDRKGLSVDIDVRGRWKLIYLSIDGLNDDLARFWHDFF